MQKVPLRKKYYSKLFKNIDSYFGKFSVEAIVLVTQ